MGGHSQADQGVAGFGQYAHGRPNLLLLQLEHVQQPELSQDGAMETIPLCRTKSDYLVRPQQTSVGQHGSSSPSASQAGCAPNQADASMQPCASQELAGPYPCPSPKEQATGSQVPTLIPQQAPPCVVPATPFAALDPASNNGPIVLEVFSGSCTVTQACREAGLQADAVDHKRHSLAQVEPILADLTSDNGRRLLRSILSHVTPKSVCGVLGSSLRRSLCSSRDSFQYR